MTHLQFCTGKNRFPVPSPGIFRSISFLQKWRILNKEMDRQWIDEVIQKLNLQLSSLKHEGCQKRGLSNGVVLDFSSVRVWAPSSPLASCCFSLSCYSCLPALACCWLVLFLFLCAPGPGCLLWPVWLPEQGSTRLARCSVLWLLSEFLE
jgi:hypothetical protein